MATLVYSTAEFRSMHGGESVIDNENRCELFADGALINKGVQIDPPTDPQLLLRAKRRFIALKLKREKDAFELFSGECAQLLAHRARYGNSSCPGPPAGYRQQIENGKERIAALQKELDALDRKIEMLPEEVGHRAFQERRRQEFADARAELNELRSLID